MWWPLGNDETKKASKTSRSSHAGQSSSSSARETYPQRSSDLSQTEMTMLTAVLHLDHTGYGGALLESQIQKLIQGLPQDLLNKSEAKRSAGGFCDLHGSLNHHLVHDILRLVQREVTSHFRQLDAYPDLISPVETEILVRLRALKGLWTKPSPTGPVAPQAWPYQINGCAACILARIASDKDALRNLRIVIQSRTRTRKNHRPRELSIFVDHAINRFNPVEAEEVHSSASQLAFGMKRARKACVKAYMRDRASNPERSGQSRRKRSHHTGKTDYVKRHRHRHQHRQREPSIASTTLSEENLVISPSLIPYPLQKVHLRESTASPSSESWDDCDDNRRRRPEAPSPESPRFKPILRQPHHPGSSVLFSEIEWGNLAKQSEKVCMYQKLAGDNPYSHATPVPEAMVDPLGVQKPRRYSESSLALLQAGVGVFDGALPKQDHVVASDPFSDWTDDECEDLDCDDSSRGTAADTTWSLVCEHHNVI